MIDIDMKAKFFSTREKAEKYKEKLKKEDNPPISIVISHYAEDSKNKDEYIRVLMRHELYFFDEEIAKICPYCVEYIRIIE